MKQKLESRLPGKSINNHRYADDTTSLAEREEELKSLLMKVMGETLPSISFHKPLILIGQRPERMKTTITEN